uniref:ABC transporter domain-containing protein n=1 Tax=Oryza glumipatula TaxID=40148 RepID=A0A0D9ZAS9_9ORYZ
MATSPLPRWAPTPSPSLPLWRTSPGGGDGAAVRGFLRSPFRTVLAALRGRSTAPHGDTAPPRPLHPAAAAATEHAAASGFDSIGIDVVGAARGEKRLDDGDGGGVFLTWEDVWVTAVDSRGHAAAIFNGVGGCARPGEVLAIMGPSGCGKTTLLDTLAGRLDLNLKMRGQILINGRSQKLAFGTSAYVTQDNVLMATLTVREAIYYSAQIQLPDTMSTAEKLARADDTVREMGLTGALDIRIGGRSSKGISGGQQKRLSICLDILTCPRLLFLDEPTSGLDSAASFHVMSRITSLAAREGMTVVAVVHQPCSEVFELFHGLCLLASGSTIFFGPASTAAEFFASNGYPCPPMRNPSNHFLRTVNKDFDKESEEGLPCMPAEEAIDILVNSYKSSNTSEVANQEMRYDRAMIGRNRPGFVTKTLARSHMLMFIATLLTFMAIGGFPSFVEDMKIFRRERLNGHYGVAAFVISNTLSSIPYLLLNAVVPGAIAYYLTGLQGKIEHFVYFALVLCACTMLVEALMMIVATIVPDFLMGIITGAGIQGIMMLTSGFFQIPNNLPKIVWKYPMYYISFHKYALQGFYKNEFSGLVFQSNLGGQETVSGEKVIVELFQVETGHSRWVDLAVLCGMIVIYRLLFVVIIKVIDVVKPMLLG